MEIEHKTMVNEIDGETTALREFFNSSIKVWSEEFKQRGIKCAEMSEIDQHKSYRGIRHPTREDEFVIVKSFTGRELSISSDFVKECFEVFLKTGENELSWHLGLMFPHE